jgi:hypothetical protein
MEANIHTITISSTSFLLPSVEPHRKFAGLTAVAGGGAQCPQKEQKVEQPTAKRTWNFIQKKIIIPLSSIK